MLSYLQKFILQMLPTISATVIGAYIVSTWINPKTPPERAKITARSQSHEPQAGKAATATTEPSQAQPAQDAAAEDAAHAEAGPAEAAKRAEAAKSARAAGVAEKASVPEKVRVIPLAKQQASTAEAPVASTASITHAEPAAATPEERRDVNELARAAIQRLRSSEAARGAEEPAKPAVASVRTLPARVATEPASPPPAAVAPPLPPAVSITSPAVIPADGEAVYPERVSPPAEIPTARNPLNLQANNQRLAENPSIADDFLSATKSFFRAITPP